MLHVKRNESAFTLIELLVVVIIVAVLAAVGVPLLSANVARARVSELEAGLGTVRTAMRAKFAEFTSYASVNGQTPLAAGLVNAGDLTGRFFDDNDYLAITSTATTFCAGATGTGETTNAPRANQVTGVSRSMNELGHLFSSADCGTGLLN